MDKVMRNTVSCGTTDNPYFRQGKQAEIGTLGTEEIIEQSFTSKKKILHKGRKVREAKPD